MAKRKIASRSQSHGSGPDPFEGIGTAELREVQRRTPEKHCGKPAVIAELMLGFKKNPCAECARRITRWPKANCQAAQSARSLICVSD
jgi:hypothetical protein